MDIHTWLVERTTKEVYNNITRSVLDAFFCCHFNLRRISNIVLSQLNPLVLRWVLLHQLLFLFCLLLLFFFLLLFEFQVLVIIAQLQMCVNRNRRNKGDTKVESTTVSSIIQNRLFHNFFAAIITKVITFRVLLQEVLYSHSTRAQRSVLSFWFGIKNVHQNVLVLVSHRNVKDIVEHRVRGVGNCRCFALQFAVLNNLDVWVHISYGFEILQS